MPDAGNRQVLLAGRPDGGVSAACFRLADAARPEPGPGELLVRVVYLSLDPAMRGWIADAPNYREPVPLGAVMPGFTVGEVTASDHPDYAVGEIVAGRQGWQEWAVSDGSNIDRKLDPEAAPISTALHLLGHTGLTAYLGLLEVGQPKRGETVVVSTAAGAVASRIWRALPWPRLRWRCRVRCAGRFRLPRKRPRSCARPSPRCCRHRGIAISRTI